MLNRKASNLIFYGTLAAIALVILLVRLALLANINGRIEEVTYRAQQLQAQIDIIDTIVSENKDQQDEHLYQLYSQIPEKYDYDKLNFKTISNLELVGVTEESIIQRDIDIIDDPTFPTNSIYSEIQEDFHIVKVEVYFNTTDVTQVDEFIDLLNDSEQIFIVSEIRYTTPDGANYMGVQVNFLAFYETLPEESEN